MVLAPGILAIAIAASVSATVPFYLKLDGVYYAVPAGATLEDLGNAWVVTQTSMSTCNRRGGEVQQFSNFALFYGPNLDIVYLGATTGYDCFGAGSAQACALAMTSTTGDVICSGAVAAPDPIFVNGFDGP